MWLYAMWLKSSSADRGSAATSVFILPLGFPALEPSFTDVRCLCFSQHGLNVRAPGFWNIFRGFCPFRRVGMPSFFQQMPILGKPYLPQSQASPAIGPRTTRRPRTRTRTRTETWLFTSMPSHTSLRPLPPTTPASIRAAFRTVTGYSPTCARARKPTMARFNHRSRIVHDAGRSKPKWIFAGSPTYRPWEPCLREHSNSPPLVSWFIVSFIMTCLLDVSVISCVYSQASFQIRAKLVASVRAGWQSWARCFFRQS